MERKHVFTYPGWIKWSFICIPIAITIVWGTSFLLTPYEQMTVEDLDRQIIGVMLLPIFVGGVVAIACVLDGERYVLRSQSLWYRSRFGRQRICLDDITEVRFWGWAYMGGFVSIKSIQGSIGWGMGLKASDHLLWQLHRRLVKAGRTDLLNTKSYLRARRCGEIMRCGLMYWRKWWRGNLLVTLGVLTGAVLSGLSVPTPTTFEPWTLRLIVAGTGLHIGLVLTCLFYFVGNALTARACIRAANPQAARLPCGDITTQKSRVVRLRCWTVTAAFLLVVVPTIVLFVLWGPRAQTIEKLHAAGANAFVMPPFIEDEYNSVNVTDEVKDPTLLPPLAPLSPLESVSVENTNMTDDELSRILAGTDLHRLSIYHSPITGGFLATVNSIQSISRLQIRETAFDDRHLAHLLRFPMLDTVIITETPIGDEGLVHLGAISQLELLNLSDTHITGKGLIHIKDRTGLVHLRLDNTGVDDEGLVHLSKMSLLQSLSLNNTAVTDGGLARLQALTSLKELNLKETALSDTGLRHFERFSSLQYLRLSGCPINGSGFQHLGSLTELTELDLSNTLLQDGHLRYIGRLAGLSTLDLTGTPITGKGLGDLSALDQLWLLNLDNTDVADHHIPYLVGLKGLRTLSLTGTQVTDECIDSLIQMEELDAVYLEDTKVTKAGYERLREERSMLLTERNQPVWRGFGPYGSPYYYPYGYGGYGYPPPSNP